MTTQRFDVVVIGGGIGGLATALDVARRGLRVCVLESGTRWGGRGASDVQEGFTFNQGPHAIYPAAWSFLRALDLKLDAPRVRSEDSVLDDGERLLPLPTSFSSFLTADWLDKRDSLDLMRALLAITLPTGKREPEETLRTWLDARAYRPNVRAIIEVLVRVATYGASPEVAAAGPALANLRSVILGGVRYVDGGWQSIVDSLTTALAQRGATMQLRTRAMALTQVEGGFQIESEEAEFRAPHIVIAGPPQLASVWLGQAHAPPSGRSMAAAMGGEGPTRAEEGRAAPLAAAMGGEGPARAEEARAAPLAAAMGGEGPARAEEARAAPLAAAMGGEGPARAEEARAAPLAAAMGGEGPARAEEGRAAPLAAACLELGLASIPEGPSSAFGIASPTYVSVHSKTARLAPSGQAMVHAALYLDDRAPSPVADRAQLEAALDRAIPSWRSHVVATRFTPRMLVSHARVEATKGLASRPSVIVPTLTQEGAFGVYRVGDWVGLHGMLLDAVLSTSRIAARACAEGPRKRLPVSSMSRAQHADA